MSSIRQNSLKLLLAAILVVSAVPVFALTITPMDNAANLAQALVGSGVTISNITYTGTNVASGYFSGGAAAGIGIGNGIVLTSGFASNLSGTSNTSDAITGSNGLPGASFLDALIPGYTTHDATILEFDFVSAGQAAYFNYVFGSDEYNEWVNSKYNDVFGFFLGVTAPSNNVALIPGTSVPVAINNVNNGSYSGYYNDNDPSDTAVPYPFEYDGFTDVFTASMTGLTPGQLYHMTLAIADAGDWSWDSGVFLQGGTFSDIPTPTAPIPEPGSLMLLGTGLLGLVGYGKVRFGKKV